MYLSLIYYRSLDHSSKRSGDLRTYSATYERTCARVCLFFFSGKSTLFHLLTRLYEPLRGAVAIDGRDVAE